MPPADRPPVVRPSAGAARVARGRVIRFGGDRTLATRFDAARALAAGTLLWLATSCTTASSATASYGEPVAESHGQLPRFDGEFWKAWGDGQAELASYDLQIPRYGALRTGTAVAIFVTETFDPEQRVKAEAPRSGSGLPVFKLNLVQDFATGIYDYNVMTSAFVALAPFEGRAPGALVKLAFGAQEWCGHVYQQVDVAAGELHHELHSYFDGEANRRDTLRDEPAGLAEDTLLLWARGFAGARPAAGAESRVPLLRSLQTTRLLHVALVWDQATLRRAAEPRTRTVPAGTFDVDVYTVAIDRQGTGPASGRPFGARGGLAPKLEWTIEVERAAPRRVVAWSTNEGYRGELVASARMKYWELNEPGGEEALGKLGLTPRPPRTP